MRKDFVNEVGRNQHIKRVDMIEKDLILHQLLLDLSKDKFFENFLFKGGTCLIKGYLGYFRFSEDIDFTWKDQKVFEDKSQHQIRRYLSPVIDKIGVILETIALKRNLDFKCKKNDRNYVELGGGNKTSTFKIWYQSEILGRRSFVKIQINFVEKMYFEPNELQLKSLLNKKQEELEVLFPEEYAEYSQKIKFGAYNIKEILCEKIRSILTRKGVKARDFLDVYMICKKFNIKLEDLHGRTVKKIQFSLNFYRKYRENLTKKKSLLLSGKIFDWGEEKDLLLIDVDEKEFYKFLEGLNVFLKKITEEI